MVFGLDKLIEIVMGKLVDVGIMQIASILGVKREMEALQSNMKGIWYVVVDLKTKKIQSMAINHWLAELQKVLHDSLKLLTKFDEVQGKNTILSKTKELFAKNNTPSKLKDINSTLEKLFARIPTLHLVEFLPNRSVDRERTVFSVMAMILDGLVSAVMEKLVDAGIKDIIAKLKVESDMEALQRNTKNIRLVLGVAESKKIEDKAIALWLAQLREVLYDADDLMDDFADANRRNSKSDNKEILLSILRNINTNLSIITSQTWILQLLASQPNAYSSRITDTYSFQSNSEIVDIDDDWSMLCKIVFKKEDKGDMKELTDVGKQIVFKCEGLPLSIKVVGGVLRMTDRTKAAWTSVLSSTIWSMQDLPENIPPSLLLSYEHLPTHLKRCFLYCSLFPRDFNFHPTKLMYMWIAEGFIQKEAGTRMEESAKEYYNELVVRNLLQVTVLDRDGSSTCKMHDLIHSLAIFVSQNQYIYVDPKTFGGSGLFRHRHLRFNAENENVVSKEIIGKEYVRTLMLSKIYTFPDQVLSGLTRLRVLDLECIKIERLPEHSVGEMRQLRFLSISARELHMLPDSIENLENLETLIISSVLESCQKGSPDSIENLENLETLMISSVLKSRSLPKGICKLDNLRHLLVSERLQNMPNGLDYLKKLRVLDCFVVNECTSSSTSRYTPNMKELKDLSQLTDLSIHNLERVASEEEAKEAAIEKKTSLKCLKLHCKPPPRISDEDIRKIEKVFKGIKIPQNMTELSIDGFFGKQLPDHMTSDHLRQVKSLELKHCKSFKKLPSLGDMPELETLHMANLSVAKFGFDFVGRLKFPKLHDFRLMEMKELVNMFEVEDEAFPCLVNLFISGCPNLKSLGEGLQHVTCLKKMTVESVLELESIENLSSISELEISWNPSLKSVKNLPSLKKMDINDCSALEVVQDVPKLSSLSISSDAEMITLPEWLKNTIASEKWHRTVTDSEELVLMSRSKGVEVKINGVKVDSNFPGASEIRHPIVHYRPKIGSFLYRIWSKIPRKRVKVDAFSSSAGNTLTTLCM